MRNGKSIWSQWNTINLSMQQSKICQVPAKQFTSSIGIIKYWKSNFPNHLAYNEIVIKCLFFIFLLTYFFVTFFVWAEGGGRDKRLLTVWYTLFSNTHATILFPSESQILIVKTNKHVVLTLFPDLTAGQDMASVDWISKYFMLSTTTKVIQHTLFKYFVLTVLSPKQ